MPTATKKAAAKKAPAKKTAAKKAASVTKESTVSKKLEVGSPVKVRVDPRQNGGSNVASGLVTKVGDETANVTVFLDSEENQWVQNVPVVKSEPKEGETSGRVCWPA